MIEPTANNFRPQRSGAMASRNVGSRVKVDLPLVEGGYLAPGVFFPVDRTGAELVEADRCKSRRYRTGVPICAHAATDYVIREVVTRTTRLH